MSVDVTDLFAGAGGSADATGDGRGDPRRGQEGGRPMSCAGRPIRVGDRVRCPSRFGRQSGLVIQMVASLALVAFEGRLPVPLTVTELELI